MTWKSLFGSPEMLGLMARLVEPLDGEYFDWQLFARPISYICPRALVFPLPLMLLLAVEVLPLVMFMYVIVTVEFLMEIVMILTL